MSCCPSPPSPPPSDPLSCPSQVVSLTGGICVLTWLLCYFTIWWSASLTPVLHVNSGQLGAIAALGATLMMARSPASAVRGGGQGGQGREGCVGGAFEMHRRLQQNTQCSRTHRVCWGAWVGWTEWKRWRGGRGRSWRGWGRACGEGCRLQSGATAVPALHLMMSTRMWPICCPCCPPSLCR